MKKIIIAILLVLIPNISLAGAPLEINSNTEQADVIATIDSGMYDKVIEVKLIPNDDQAKVFYYTDSVGRFDQQIQYKLGSSIEIKKDTILNYHSISNNITASLIKENKYTFNYPKNLEIFYENNNIFIKNNENKIVYLKGWKIGNFEINENISLNPNEIYKYNYDLKENETISLFSPDNNKINSYTRKTIQKEIIVKNDNIQKNAENINKTEKVITEEKSNEQIENKNPINSEKIENNSGNLENTINIGNISNNKTEEQKNTDLEDSTGDISNISNDLKTSILDKKDSKNNYNFIILIIVFFIIGMIGGIIYNKKEKSN
ncbi:MAG: hypothetical protein PHR68_02560 [Candidatus Gracilibacteria bacterium]|nr:hypothetical protein [Candidatus Gracilibacteria bacterium]